MIAYKKTWLRLIKYFDLKGFSTNFQVTQARIKIKNIKRIKIETRKNIHLSNVRIEPQLDQPQLNININFSEQWANETKFLGKHNDHLAESINVVENYLEYLKKGNNMGINFTEHVAEHVSNINFDNVAESTTTRNRIETNNLDSKIDNIIESAKKQKAESLSEQSNFPYFKLLNENNQREFLVLEDNQKQRIIEAVAQSKPMNEQDFVSIWRETLNPSDPTKITEKIISGMPEEYKPAWESLTESKRNDILNKTKFYNMDTPYQIKYFWHSIKELHESVGFTSLNESKINNAESTYGSEYLKNLAIGLQRFKK